MNRFQKGVIKPDQLIKRRGKHGLVKLGTANELKEWFHSKKGQYVTVSMAKPSTMMLKQAA